MAHELRLAHFGLRTSNLPAAIDWYGKAFNAKTRFRNDVAAFMSFDDEHHRFVLWDDGETSAKPATSGVARTATNVRAGGRTPVAGIVHAVVILFITVWVGWLAAYLAMPALAALLIVTAWMMSEPGRWGERMKLPRSDRTLLLLTMMLTVLTDLVIAIAVGTVAGLALRLMRRNVEPAEWKPTDRSKP